MQALFHIKSEYVSLLGGERLLLRAEFIVATALGKVLGVAVRLAAFFDVVAFVEETRVDIGIAVTDLMTWRFPSHETFFFWYTPQMFRF
jgi:hypothetical protein